MQCVELVLLIVSLTRVTAALLPKGPNSYEVREDFLYEVTLTESFVFAGTAYDRVFISDNGVISLDNSFKGGELETYTFEKPWLAPYGADVGGGSFGLLYFNEVPSTDSSAIQTIKDIIQLEYKDALSTTSPSLILVATWENVKQFPASADNTLTNTFQAVIVSDGTETYIIFLYQDLQWGPAVVGISSGVTSNRLVVCGSRTDLVKYFSSRSQQECSNSPGHFVFRVDPSTMITSRYTCTQTFIPRDCTASGTNEASRNRRCPAR